MNETKICEYISKCPNTTAGCMGEKYQQCCEHYNEFKKKESEEDGLEEILE